MGSLKFRQLEPDEANGENVYMFIFYFYQNMSNFIVSNWEGQNPRL